MKAEVIININDEEFIGILGRGNYIKCNDIRVYNWATASIKNRIGKSKPEYSIDIPFRSLDGISGVFSNCFPIIPHISETTQTTISFDSYKFNK